MERKKKSVGIYIPTLNRVGKERQLSLKEFLSKSSHVPTLVCPKSEVKDHLKYHDKVLKCKKKGIGKVRQWILENAKEDVVILCDDDINFQFRPDEETTKLEQATDLDPMIKQCVRVIRKGYIHGGVSARQGNNHIKVSELDNKRNCNFHFLSRKKVLKTEARFDRLPVMEDFHFILSLLTQGFPNRIIYNYCWNQKPGSVGGCNTYRTLELQAEAAEGLKEAFPDFVTVVEKTNKTDWSIAKGTRKDVRVQWKKAYESSGGAK